MKTVQLSNGEIKELKPEDFAIDTTLMERELCNMGSTMLHYAEIEVELKAEVERKETALVKLEADIDTNIRSTAAANNEKITEAKISTQVKGDLVRLQLLEELATIHQNHNMMRWAMKALDAKRDCLLAYSYRERQLMKSEQY